MLLDEVELRLGERAGTLENRVGDAQLADVVQEPADGEIAKALRRETELLADLHRAQGDAARVLFRVLVLLDQVDEKRAHV